MKNTVEQTLIKYDKLVPFPISSKKIREAGYVPRDYVQNILNDLLDCTDRHKTHNKKLIEAMSKKIIVN